MAVNDTEYVPVPGEEGTTRRKSGKRGPQRPKRDPARVKALYGLAMVYAQLYQKATGYDYPANDLKPILKAMYAFPDSYTIEDMKTSIVGFMNPRESWHAQQDPPLLEVHFWQKNMTHYLPSKRKRTASSATIGTGPGTEPPAMQEDQWEELERARQRWIDTQKGGA